MLSAFWRTPAAPAPKAPTGDNDLDALSAVRPSALFALSDDAQQAPKLVVVSDSDDEGGRGDDSVTPPEDDDDEDAVPAFPALNSIQRAGGGGSRASGGLALPHSTTSKPAPVKRSGRGKVALEPGFSQLDWARLKASGADLKVRV